jgi:hypothetical protein
MARSSRKRNPNSAAAPPSRAGHACMRPRDACHLALVTLPRYGQLGEPGSVIMTSSRAGGRLAAGRGRHPTARS